MGWRTAESQFIIRTVTVAGGMGKDALHGASSDGGVKDGFISEAMHVCVRSHQLPQDIDAYVIAVVIVIPHVSFEHRMDLCGIDFID